MRAAVIAIGVLFAATALAQVSLPLPPMADRLPRPREAIATNDGGVQRQAFAFAGREDRIAAGVRPQSTCETLPGVKPIEYIVERTRGAQIVMINEAHDSPRDRRFIEDLAVELSKLDFSTYAAETLYGGEPSTPGKFARITDGYYLNEPAFGSLYRRIAALGYKLVPYEDAAPALQGRHFTESINARETVQSSNLINRTVRLDPSMKVLVHVGHGHNQESAARIDGREVRWMATRFKEITGIDPLTIDQTLFSADADGVCAQSSSAGQSRDIFIARSPLTFDRSRPVWRVAAGQRLVDVPQTLRQPGARTIYEARFANEPDDAVPVDRVLVDPGEDIPLLLPPGRFKVRGWTASGGWSENVTVTVAAPRPPPPANAKSKQRRKKQ